MSVKEALNNFLEKNLSEAKQDFEQELGAIALRKLDEVKFVVAKDWLTEAKDYDDEDDDDDEGNDEEPADKDHDGDGEVESKENEYKGSRDKAIKKAMKSEGRVKAPRIKDEDPFKKSRREQKAADKGKTRYNKDGSVYKRKPVHEDEQIDELGDKTLKSYRDKADKNYKEADKDYFKAKQGSPEREAAQKTLTKRAKGKVLHDLKTGKLKRYKK